MLGFVCDKGGLSVEARKMWVVVDCDLGGLQNQMDVVCDMGGNDEAAACAGVLPT